MEEEVWLQHKDDCVLFDAEGGHLEVKGIAEVWNLDPPSLVIASRKVKTDANGLSARSIDAFRGVEEGRDGRSKEKALTVKGHPSAGAVCCNLEFKKVKSAVQFDEGNDAKDFCVWDYPDEFSLLTKAKQPFKILVRESYKEIWTKVDAIPCGKVVIMGNPGIGKSSLLLYASIEQALAGKKVYLISQILSKQDATNREVFCFDRAKEEDGKVTVASRVGPLSRFAREIGSASNALILMDGKALNISFQASESLVVLACSPKKDNHFEWGKNAKYLCMGVWSEDEIWAANDLIYKIDQVTVKKRLEAMGHVPHVIFNQPWTDGQMTEGIQAFAQNPLWHHEELLKIIPNKDYSGYTYGFLSGSLYEQGSEALLAKGQDELRLFVEAATQPLYATLRGNLYGYPANNALRKGGDFRVRKLNPNGEKVTEETWTLPRHVFQLVPTSQRKPENKTFYLPQTGQGTYDGYLTGPVLCNGAPLFPGESRIYFVQDTVSLSHSKEVEFITNALKKFGNNYKGVMCFTVPSDIFEDFKFQKWKNHLGNVIYNTHDEIPQYVICVPADRIRRENLEQTTKPKKKEEGSKKARGKKAGERTKMREGGRAEHERWERRGEQERGGEGRVAGKRSSSRIRAREEQDPSARERWRVKVAEGDRQLSRLTGCDW